MKKPIEEVRALASKGPFSVDGSGCKIVDTNYYKMASCDVGGCPLPSKIEREDANAQLIAHCLNTHQELLDALRECKSMIAESYIEDSHTTIMRADNAIEKASFVEVGE